MSKIEYPVDDFSRFGVNGQPAVEAALDHLAEEILRSFVPDGFCLIQDWDGSLQCYAKLADGSVIGESIPLVNLTSTRIRETGKRLQGRARGEDIDLRNEIFPPILIVPGQELDPAVKALLKPLMQARDEAIKKSTDHE